MKKILLGLFFLLILHQSSKAFMTKVDSIYYGRFGKVMLYYTAKVPHSVVLFISGDGGWNHGVVNMGKYMAFQGALVLGIDAKVYKQNLSKWRVSCYNLTDDFLGLSNFIQEKYHFVVHVKPIMMGYSYGATLAYGIVAQAPKHTFLGTIVLGFCPDIELDKPLCEGMGIHQHVLQPGVSFDLDRFNGFADLFIVINGIKDETCPIEATQTFLKGLKNVDLMVLKKVGHGFSIADNWLPHFKFAYQQIANITEASLLKPK
ncbi:MAG: hypothetical protein IE931_04100 [Sphingobacteriales bacterium]|nr:hypothetical protein [Sphingobacteriales bacterium]